MDIRLEYSLTSDDYYEFTRAYIRERKSLIARSGMPRVSRMPLLLIFIGFIVLLVVLTSYLFPTAPEPGPPAKALTLTEYALSLLPYLAIFLMAWAFLYWLRRSKLLYRPYFSEMHKLSEPHVTEITERQITIRQQGMTASMEWSYFLAFVEGRSIFALFTSARMGHIIPKRAFASQEELRNFQEFVHAHVGRPPLGFPVQPPRPEESLMSGLPVQQAKEQGR